jgi:flagellar hook-length control protein FliK
MEQMNVMLAIPNVSSATVSTTQPTDISSDQESFASIYEQNIHETDQGKNLVSVQEKPVTEENNSSANIVDENTSTDETTPAVQNESSNADQLLISSAVAWQALLAVAMSAGTTEEQVETQDESITEQAAPVAVIESQQMDGDTDGVTDQKQAESKVVETNLKTQNVDEINNGKGEFLPPTDEQPVEEKQTPIVASDSTKEVASTQIISSNIASESGDGTEVIQKIQTDTKVEVANTVVETTKTVNATVTEEVELPSTTNLQQTVLEQIQASLGKVVKSGSNEIRLQLEPENLGVLNIRIVAGKEGAQVVFKTDNLQSSQLINSQVDALKTMMAESGIKVDQVVVNDFSFSQQNFQNQQQQFDQKSGSSYSQNVLLNLEQSEQWENPYELSQSIVGLNYLV